MFNKILFALAICFAGVLSHVNAQTYLEEGKTYSFTALNKDGSKEVTLNVVFDKEGVATVSRKEAAPTDKSHSGFFFLTKEETNTTFGDDKSGNLEVKTKTPQNYTYISFDGEIYGRATGTANTAVTCICSSKFGDGSCDLSYQGSGASQGCLQCTSNRDNPCGNCKVSITSSYGNISGSTLLIQAKEVRFAR
jgi:hypothetical protein